MPPGAVCPSMSDIAGTRDGRQRLDVAAHIEHDDIPARPHPLAERSRAGVVQIGDDIDIAADVIGAAERAGARRCPAVAQSAGERRDGVCASKRAAAETQDEKDEG